MSARLFVLGHREVDLDRAEVRSGASAVPLTPNEVKLLSHLAEHKGQVVDRDDLMCAALGYNKSVTSRAIDQAIWRLRRKLEDEPHQPRWLLSEANAGYRLALSAPDAGRSVLGREAEIRRLDALLAAHPTVAIAGLPGSDRAALAEIATSSANGIGRRVQILDHMPSDPAIPVLRLGPLPKEASIARLTSAILSARGATALSEEEEPLVALLAERAGHHPGTLAAVAQASVLSHLEQIATIPPDPAHLRLIDALDPDVREALARCAVFPDAFTPAEADLPAELLARTWRALVLDAVDGVDGVRRFVVPPCIRTLILPTEPSGRAFVDIVIRVVQPSALAALDGLDREYMAEITRAAPRIERALALAPPERATQLLSALFVQQLATGRLVPSVVARLESIAGGSPDDEALRCLLLAAACEATSPREAQDLAQRAVSIASERGSPLIAAHAVRSAFRLALKVADHASLPPLISALASLSEREQRSFISASYRHLNGLYLLTKGLTDAARKELLAALSLYSEGSAAKQIVWSNLATEAARDGRVSEALAWSERVPLDELPVAEEGRERLRRATMYAVAGDLAASQRELTVAEMLGTRALSLQIARSQLALLRGEIEHAIVLSETVPERQRSAEEAFACTMVLGWARLARGQPELALDLAEQEQSSIAYADYRAQKDLLRAAALARLGRVSEARALLHAIPTPTSRWWPVTRAVADALLGACAGTAPDFEALQRELDRGTAHLVARFAMIAMRAQIAP